MAIFTKEQVKQISKRQADKIRHEMMSRYLRNLVYLLDKLEIVSANKMASDTLMKNMQISIRCGVLVDKYYGKSRKSK